MSKSYKDRMGGHRAPKRRLTQVNGCGCCQVRPPADKDPENRSRRERHAWKTEKDGEGF